MKQQNIELLETELDSFDTEKRATALDMLQSHGENDDIALSPPKGIVNQHAHTFYSYNAYGYSPSKFAWLAKKEGLDLAGVVDFDVLDGIEEFLAAADQIGLKGCGGMETRVFIPEFAEEEINSPGEPGVAYHLGLGFTSSDVPENHRAFYASLKDSAQARNAGLIERVNAFLAPVELDIKKDLLPLAPAGNATERHICLAYAHKAAAVFNDPAELATFWTEKLGINAAELDLPEGRDLQNTIRAKTMKSGGAGYVQPDSGSFPRLRDFNEFVLACNAIPTIAWLNGLTQVESHIENLLSVHLEAGAAMINIVPDRNFTAGVKDEKLANLYAIVELTQKHDLPIIAGTEMNSPGNLFVDDFDREELKPLLPVFMEGGYILYAHSALQRACGKGYLSVWAAETFADTKAKNEFFAETGRALRTGASAEEIEKLLP